MVALPLENLTDEEIQLLLNTKSETEWNATCDKVKHARGGQYPHDWFMRVVVSGLMTIVSDSWKKNNPR